MKKLILTTTLLILTGWTQTAIGGELTAEGRWRTIDDNTGKPNSVVEIWIENGELKGRILELLNPTGPDQKCDKCKGEKKGQSVTGMEFMWGLVQKKDLWDGGRILDPDNGKVYRAKVKVLEGGEKLEVRGYIGISLIGRSQVWERIGEDLVASSGD